MWEGKMQRKGGVQVGTGSQSEISLDAEFSGKNLQFDGNSIHSA
jgi:hypothetical protein